MNFEVNDLFTSENQDEVKDVNSIESQDFQEVTEESGKDVTFASINPALIGYGATKIANIPAVKDFINDCKESIKEKISDAKDSISDFFKGLIGSDDVKSLSMGEYDTVPAYSQAMKNAHSYEQTLYSKEFSETREFGLDKCVEAAEEYFNAGVISEWSNLSTDQREGICCAYAEKVAEAFELEKFEGVTFEKMPEGTYGSNNGDGVVHLNSDLLNSVQTPLLLVDTITHELRHQYQKECINGGHDVSDEVRNEWSVAESIYTTNQPWAYDPWGYIYNPTEIDSRYAGETVVRELSSKIFNAAVGNV